MPVDLRKLIEIISEEKIIVAFVNIITIIGFFITIYVYLNVRSINNWYVNKVRVPQHLKKIKVILSKISAGMDDPINLLPQTEIELINLEVELKGINSKLARKKIYPINELLKTLKSYDIKSGNIDILRSIYLETHKMIISLESFQEDQKWEK